MRSYKYYIYPFRNFYIFIKIPHKLIISYFINLYNSLRFFNNSQTSPSLVSNSVRIDTEGHSADKKVACGKFFGEGRTGGSSSCRIKKQTLFRSVYLPKATLPTKKLPVASFLERGEPKVRVCAA